MGYRSVMSSDILLKNERYPIDLSDIRLNSFLEGEKKESTAISSYENDFYGILVCDVRRYPIEE